MYLKKKSLIPIFMILSGLGSIIRPTLVVGFSIILFDKDRSGVATAYLEQAGLLGIGCAGLLGGFFFKRFSSYTIGTCSILLGVFILLCLLWYGDVNIRSCTVALWALASINGIEHANGLAFISRQMGDQDKPVFFSNIQILLQFFSILAPIGAKNLLTIWGFKALLFFCILADILRILLWKQCRSIDPGVKVVAMQPYGILTGFKELVQNPGLLRMTSFRIINQIATVAYTISLPILVAKIANENSQINAQLYSYSLSIIQLGFFLSGICGSWILKRKPKLIICFFNISPILIILATIIAWYTIQPLYLQATAFLYGMGLYVFRTAVSVMAQALTKKDKLAHVILAGDAMIKSFGYGISSLIPFWMFLPPIWGIMPPFVGCVLCSLLSLGVTKPIVKLYLASLCKRNDTK